MLRISKWILTCLIYLMLIGYALANPSGFNIGSITVVGNYALNDDRIIDISGLEDKWQISSEDLQHATTNLWSLGIFSDIKIQTSDHRDKSVDVTILVEEYARLKNLYISGIDVFSEDRIKDEIGVENGMIVSSYKMSQIRQGLKKMYISEGYNAVNINIYTVPLDSALVNLIVDIDEGEEIEIEKIHFHGNRVFEDGQLKKIMQSTKENRWFHSAHFSEEGYNIDLDRIVHFYKSNGYIDAEIVHDSISYGRDRSDMTIDIWVDEGLPYYIAQVGFEGNFVFNDQQLDDYCNIRRNDLYSLSKIQKALARLSNKYYDLGHFYTAITANEIPLSRDSVKVLFVIDEKNEVKIRNVSISGNTFTKDKIIRRQLLVLPGQRFNNNLLKRSQRDLLMSNYFSSVYPFIKPVDEDNVDIIFEVQEKITSNTDLSGGWSKQSGFTGGLGLQTDNFFGNGQSVGLHSNIGQNSKFFSFNYTEPWLLDKPVSAGLGLYYKDQDEHYSGYSQKSFGGAFRIGHKFKWPDDYFQMDWIYKFDRTILNNFSNQIIETNPMGIIDQSYPLTSSSLTHVISRNSLDRYDFPKSGSDISLSNEISGGFLRGNADYHKHELNGDWYTSLSENLVLKTNFTGGIMNGYGKNSTIPYLQRFFLGGGGMSSSLPLRGYIDPLSSESGNKNGGTAMMKGGLELRYRISKQPLIYALTFAEVGETWNKINQVTFTNLRRSVGFGVRVDVPYLGLIGVDFAYGFDTFNPATGRRQGQWQIHFIIGKLF